MHLNNTYYFFQPIETTDGRIVNIRLYTITDSEIFGLHVMSAGARIVLAQPQIGQGSHETLTNNTSIAKLDLVNAVGARRVGVAQAVDEEHPQLGDRHDGLPGPFHGKVWRNHDERGKGFSPCGDVKARQRNEGFAGAALRDHGRRTRFGQALNDSMDGDSL
ncbi:MAG: hypothetical protein ACRD2O_04070 [Terriglobia bacterium]